MKEKRYKKRKLNKIVVDQGDIFSNIKMEEYKTSLDEIDNNELIWDKVLVLSQSCDLHREQENPDISNEILSVLVIPIFRLSDFQEGIYLKQLNKEKEPLSEKGLRRRRLENEI